MEAKRYLSIDEFRDVSGLPPVTIRRYVRKGKLPFLQPGGPGHRILIPANALEALVPLATTAPPTTKPSISGPKPRWLKRTEGTNN